MIAKYLILKIAELFNCWIVISCQLLETVTGNLILIACRSMEFAPGLQFGILII